MKLTRSRMDTEWRFEQMVQVLRDFGIDAREHVLDENVFDRILVPFARLFGHVDVCPDRTLENGLPTIVRIGVGFCRKIFVQLRCHLCAGYCLSAGRGKLKERI